MAIKAIFIIINMFEIHSSQSLQRVSFFELLAICCIEIIYFILRKHSIFKLTGCARAHLVCHIESERKLTQTEDESQKEKSPKNTISLVTMLKCNG